ncbi:MAG: hypothetical protein Q9182_002148 [Xanthomendoza sp. 2 TL-2023]
MGFFVDPPFALFCLEQLSSATLDKLLLTAYDGSFSQWYFYLATASYDSAPKENPDGTPGPGTRTPIPASFTSSFVGQSVADVAQWLKQKPEEVTLEPKFFAVLDKKATEGKVVLCRVGDREGKGDEVSCVLEEATYSSLTLAGMEYGTWEELVHDRGEYEPDI